MGWGCRLQGRMVRQTKKFRWQRKIGCTGRKKAGRCVRPSNLQRTPWNLSYFWSRTIAVWPPRLQAALQLLWLIINEPELCTIKRFLISIISLFKFRYFKKRLFLLPSVRGRRHISRIQVCIKACQYLINNSIWISAHSIRRKRLPMPTTHTWSSK